ncbi:MAG: SDR family oxidoreductase [Elusimicrobia bacterium]|nr:SDR family oxidoreductase [Elusimicrobiota bacterium]
MEKRKILFTGFPGFIGKRITAALLKADADLEIICLVQEKFLSDAQKAAAQLEEKIGTGPGKASRLFVYKGDITDSHLGFSDDLYRQLTQGITEAWHLAAIYDLAVPESFARKINIEGTRHILEFCRACQKFDKLIYFSTCYVAGNRTGLIKETELDEGQGFKNHYESTKFLAEVEVRKAIASGLPAMVIRPAVVVGDSMTGETDKFDGPYFGMQLVSQLKWVPLGLPKVGASLAEVNLVPVDYLVTASIAISRRPGAVGKTFQIADPKPLQAFELYDLFCRWITGKPALPISIPPKLMEWTLASPLGRWLGAPKEVLTYFNHGARYDSTQTTKILEGTGVKCPDVREYLPRLHQYWQAHRQEPGRQAKA